MKVLLINPPQHSEILDNNPVIISEGRGYNPPLGLLYIAAYLQKHSVHEVKVIDCQVEKDDYESLGTKIKGFGPDVVGITVMTMTLLDVIETLRVVSSVAGTAKVVLGGPHVNLFPEETIRFEGVDFLVLGEGEETFHRLLGFINDPDELGRLPGLVFRDGAEVVYGPDPQAIRDLDALPFPARRLTPFHKYSSVLAKRGLVTTIFTSRGCPYKCAFCDRPHLGKTFRARSALNVVDEMEECSDMGIHEFLVYDDTFTVSRKRVLEICDEIAARGLHVGFDIRARVDTVDEEMIRRLKSAGCQGIHYGVEAGADRILKVLNKGITLDQVKETFDLTRKHGVPILAYFMIGNPSETLEEIETTFSVIKRLNPDYLHLTVLCPFPGTQTYREALERGVIRNDPWRELARNPSEEFVPPHWGEFFTRDELHALVVKGYKQFYLRPSYILRRLANLSSFAEFVKKAGGGLRVIGLR